MSLTLTEKQQLEDARKRIRELEGEILAINAALTRLDNTIAGYRFDMLKAISTLTISRSANDILIAIIAEKMGISIEELTGMNNAN